MHIMQRLRYYANYERTLYYYHNYIDYAYNVNYAVETWVGSGNQSLACSPEISADKGLLQPLCCWLGFKVRFLVVCDAIAQYGW